MAGWAFQINFMDLAALPSIAEVCGEPGSGRASFCLALMAGVRTLWIDKDRRFSTARAASAGLDLALISVVEIPELARLARALEFGEIGGFVTRQRVQLIVVGGLTSHAESAEFLPTAIEIVYALKKIYLESGVKTVVITDSGVRVTRRAVLLAQSPPWNYAMPARFQITRNPLGGDRVVALVKPEPSPAVKFLLSLGPSGIKVGPLCLSLKIFMRPSLPSHELRKILRSRRLSLLAGVREVSLCGKIIRRSGPAAVLFDSFCGITLRARELPLQLAIDQSIDENYLVRAVCAVEASPAPHLRLVSLRPASFQEEMYRTLESMEYWKKILLQKQPK